MPDSRPTPQPVRGLPHPFASALVTGGGGFLGTALVRRLVERGVQVRSLSRSRYPHLAAIGVQQFSGDLRNLESVEAACRGMQVVFHVAAKTGIAGPDREFFEINTTGTRNVIRACRTQGVERLIYTSSPSVVIGSSGVSGGVESLPYPVKYLAPYPASKAQAERDVLGENSPHLATCALRPHLVWGPGDPHLIPRVLAAVRAGRLAIVGAGTNRVDLTYVDNAVHAHVLAAEYLAPQNATAGQAYFIGDAEPVVLWEWINTLLERLGLPPVTRRVSYPKAAAAGALLELVHALFPRLREPRMTRFLALQFAKDHYFLHDKAERDFSYRPVVSNRSGLDLLVGWIKDNRADLLP